MTLNRKNAHRAAEDRRAMYRSRNGALLLAARRIAPAAARRAARGTLAGTLLSRGASIASAGRAGIALAEGALAIAGAHAFAVAARADRGRAAASHAGARRGAAADPHAGVPPMDDDLARGLAVMRVAPFPDHRRRGLAIDVVAGLPAVNDDVVAPGGSHADRCAAAAMNRNARAAGTLTHRRAATALHLIVGCGLAAGRIAIVAAVALAGAAL